MGILFGLNDQGEVTWSLNYGLKFVKVTYNIKAA